MLGTPVVRLAGIEASLCTGWRNVAVRHRQTNGNEHVDSRLVTRELRWATRWSSARLLTGGHLRWR